MRADFTKSFDSLSTWRSSILSKLDHWRSQLQQVSDPHSNSYGNDRWVSIVYNHCLLYLYRPTKSNVRGPAGDWSVRASVQTALVFRKFQADQSIAHPWLGVRSLPSHSLSPINLTSDIAYQPVLDRNHPPLLSLGNATAVPDGCL
jgi:hypothetical protein